MMARTEVGHTVRVYGHVHGALMQYSQSDETLNEALVRLLPDENSIIEFPEKDTKIVWTTEDTHHQIKEAAGENVNMSDVIEYHLRQEGEMSDADITREAVRKLESNNNE